MSQDGVEETGSEDGPGTEQTEDKDDEEKLEREKTAFESEKTKENTKNRDDKNSPSHGEVLHHAEGFAKGRRRY